LAITHDGRIDEEMAHLARRARQRFRLRQCLSELEGCAERCARLEKAGVSRVPRRLVMDALEAMATAVALVEIHRGRLHSLALAGGRGRPGVEELAAALEAFAAPIAELLAPRTPLLPDATSPDAAHPAVEGDAFAGRRGGEAGRPLRCPFAGSPYLEIASCSGFERAAPDEDEPVVPLARCAHLGDEAEGVRSYPACHHPDAAWTVGVARIQLRRSGLVGIAPGPWGGGRRRERVCDQPLAARATTAQLNAAWNVGRTRFLMTVCERSVRERSAGDRGGLRRERRPVLEVRPGGSPG
jgi:hypothetical protein